MVWRPVSHVHILYPVLALLACLSLVDLVRRRAQLQVPFVVCGYALALAGCLAALVGSFRSTPGLAHQSTVWFGGLVIWALWAAALEVNYLRRIFTTIALSTIAVSAALLIYAAGETGFLPSVLPESLLIDQDARFVIADRGLTVNFLGLTTLTIAAPLMIAGALAPPDPMLPSRRLLTLAAVLATAASFVSGRRGIIVVVLAAPMMFAAVKILLGGRVWTKQPTIARGVQVALALPILFAAALWFSTTTMADQTSGAVKDAALVLLADSGEVVRQDDVVRVAQSEELLSAWAQKPLVGWGLGAVLDSGFARSDDRPWMFELQYHQLLFSAGLIGVVLVVGAVLAAVIGLRRAAHATPGLRSTIAVSAVGTLAIVAANGSNPYLQTPGRQWGIALVLGVGNAALSKAMAQRTGGSAPTGQIRCGRPPTSPCRPG